MIQLVLVVTLAVGAFAAPNKIVGGEEANIEDFPYQLSLQSRGYHICGASLIAENFAVTAAHCTDGKVADQLSIRAGSSVRNDGGQVVQVARIFQHPKYKLLNKDYDISVLQLKDNVVLNSGARIVNLPDQDEEIITGSTVVATGWGRDAENGSGTNHLKMVVLPFHSQETCQKVYEDLVRVTDRQVCAGFLEGGQDTCQGDSGGPLQANGKLLGIVSWGMGCAREGRLGIYTRVSSVRDYIQETAGF